jgi:PAS domain S-box-containing protein
VSTRAHVVVINDDPVQLRQITALLGAADHEATGFLDASDALTRLSGRLDVGLFVVDLHMPGIDGWKLCRLLRSSEFERFNRTPILVISATFTGDDVAAITRELGANAFLEVPFEGAKLIAYVESLLLGEIPSEPSWILIVEDDDAVRRSLGRAFSAHGYRVEGAATLAEARDKHAQRQFDLVLLDHYLPDGSAEDGLEELRRPTHRTTTLVMTGDADPMLPVRLLEKGADGYLRKPFDPAFAVELARKARRQRSLLRIETILEARTRELRASEGRCRTLFDTSPDIVLVADEHGRVAEVNPDGLRALRCQADDVLGRPLVEFADPPRVKALSRWLDAVEVGGVSSLETDLVAQSGSSFPVELTGRRIDYHGAPATLVVGRDLTERRRNEEERHKHERQMQHAQRLESLGVLAGGVAHDFNNLLVGILGNASLALMDLTGDSPVREAVNQIELAARRAAELTQQILAFAGKGRTDTQEMDLSSLVREMGQLVEPAVSKKAQVTYELPDTLPGVKGDPGQIRQVAMNLIINASDSLGGKAGTISVSTSMQEVTPTGGPELVGGERLEPGHYVALRVEDDGCGMEADTLARIFEPFFTTKFTGRGLGLAATLGIVRSHGGGIAVRSVPGGGTTMTVLFPPSQSVVPETDGGDSPSAPKWTGGGTVLVVDDEPSVRKLVRAALSRNGFAVIEARNGAEGVVMALDPAGEVDVVVLDLTMPEMDGREALAVIRERRPDLPVLLSSGYPPEEVDLKRAPGEPTDFLKKPYGPSELLDAVSGLLGTRAAARASERRAVRVGL